ncbi:MAG: ABC transporter ATP-binding protein [Clostridiales Family XIII bacterium]|jgi:spermidine/putrescine transport system ATP-binding protein|nr:ABC transporter ATP-binding protein [Clostridiales Family XIII bacterium]
MSENSLELVNIVKSYGDVPVIRDFSLTIREGEFVSLLGPSGCGKTTLLRIIAGFESPDSGQVLLGGVRIDGLPPHKRNVNTIFQDYALFPHYTVFENIAYGLRLKNIPQAEIETRVLEMLKMVRMEGFERRRISQMSGGQRQRVSLARAIVNNAPFLLLDEALTALDTKLRKEMRFELRRLQQALGITFIYVTHDQEEAMVMSDRIVLLENGVIQQEGTPTEIYKRPEKRFSADFIGESNLFEATVIQTCGGIASLSSAFGRCPADTAHTNIRSGQFVDVSVRPENLLWSTEPVPDFDLPTTVQEHIFTGSCGKAILAFADGSRFTLSRIGGIDLPEIGTQGYVHWKPQDAVVMISRSDMIFNTIEDVNLGEFISR